MKKILKQGIRIFWCHYSYIVGLYALAIAYPYGKFIGNNPTFLSLHQLSPFKVVVLGMIVFLGIAIVLCLVKYILFLVNKKLAKYYDYFLLICCVLLISLYNEISRRIAVMAPGNYAISLLWLLSMIILSLALLAFSSRKYRDIFRISSVVLPLLICNFYFFSNTASNILYASEPTKKNDSQKDIKNPVPIVFLLMDQFSLRAILNKDNNIDSAKFPNYAELARNSTWFSNARTVSSDTIFAVPTILTGCAEQLLAKPTPNLKTYPNNMFTWLNKYSWKLNIEEFYTNLAPECGKKNIKAQNNLLNDLFFLGICFYFPSITEGKIFSSAIDKWFDFQEYDADWKFSNWCDEIDVEPRSLNYYHFKIPHVPVKHMPDGERYNNLSIDSSTLYSLGKPSLRNLAYWQYRIQCAYTDTLLGKLVKILKDRGIYDKCLLVVAADHGTTYQVNRGFHDIDDYTLVDIGFIPLFVKLPHQKKGEEVKNK